jgi:Protein of unknown function (DUF1364)
MTLQKRKPFRSKAITQAANDEACTICGRNDGTTVFCHLNESWAGKGMGQKADDCAGFFGCRTCHAIYDGAEIDTTGDPDVLRAYYRTIRRLLDLGILRVEK